MKKQKKLIRLIAVMIILALLCGCSSVNGGSDAGGEEKPADAPEPADQSESSGTDAPNEPDAEQQGTEVPDEPDPDGEREDGKGDPVDDDGEPARREGHYTFKPKVCSVYMEDVFGTGMRDAWFNLVDAVMAGENTFECPDQYTYDWVMGQFPDQCFPVLDDLITYAWDRGNAVIDGVASFEYTVPVEEAAARIADFTAMIEGILNEVLEDDYSDLEKALAMYEYFADAYVYDYDLYYDMYVNPHGDLNCMQLFNTGMGICQQISVAYSYLLMQAGLDATVMSGHRSYDHESHQWSYVRINGLDYHIDPTYGLGNGRLDYFMMSDDQREAADGYDRSDYTIVSHYSNDNPHDEYAAADDTFSPLWGGEYVAFDSERNVLNYLHYNDDYEYVEMEFDYSGY